MPKKGDRRWHRMLMHDPRVADWYENRARRSRRSVDESLRRIARGTFDALGKTPLDLLAMDQEELENVVSKCIGFHLDQKKLLGSTTNSFCKTLKSFLKWHRRKIERENDTPGAEEYPNAEDATIPDQDALRATLRVATPKTAVMLAVVEKTPELVPREATGSTSREAAEAWSTLRRTSGVQRWSDLWKTRPWFGN